MNAPQVVDFLQTIVFLLPVAGLIWKAASLSFELKDLRKDFDAAYDKTCKRTSLIEDALKTSDTNTALLFQSMKDMLADIKVNIARIETKLEERGA